MAAKPRWLLRIPEIIGHVRELRVPVIDRPIVEQLFDLKRRRAIELMHQFGGYQAGRTFLIDRLRLLDCLDQLRKGEEFSAEAKRRERLSAGLSTLRRYHVGTTIAIPVRPEVFSTRMKQLNEGVRIASGQLMIEFSSTEDLLSKLFELAQAAANDFETFQAMTSLPASSFSSDQPSGAPPASTGSGNMAV